MEKIDVHADDYGMSSNTSKDILNCLKKGKLNSISILTNMSEYSESANWLKKEWNNLPIQPLLTVHLNFVEGRCVAQKSKVSMLVDKEGYFKISWGTLFKWNYHPFLYQKIKKQLKEEIKAQTDKFLEEYGEYIQGKLRFDGHQHTQMIPIVYRALKEVVEEEGYTVSYIRVTKEPIKPYLRKMHLYNTYIFINWIKNLLLNYYSLGMEHYWKDLHFQKMYLWGVLMSGRMDEKRVKELFPLMKEEAKRRKRTLEILFHPGTLLEQEISDEFTNSNANRFYLSDARGVEFETLHALDITKEEK